MDTLCVELLRAAEFEVSKTLAESFTHAHILQLLLDQVACVLDQIKSDLQVSSLDQLIEYGHGLLEDVKLLDFLAGPCRDDFAALKGVEFEHLAHLLLFEVIDAFFGGAGLLLYIGQVVLNLVEVVEGDCELVKVLGKFSAQVLFNDSKLLR